MGMNDLLSEIYDNVRGLDNVTMLDVPTEAVVMSAHHKWGAAPFHYTDETDRVIAAALLAAAGLGASKAPPSANVTLQRR